MCLEIYVLLIQNQLLSATKTRQLILFREMKRKNKISSSHAMKLYRKIGGVAPLILNLSAGWR